MSLITRAYNIILLNGEESADENEWKNIVGDRPDH